MSGDGSTTVVVSTETVSETVNEDSNLNFSNLSNDKRRIAAIDKIMPKNKLNYF